ncbi:MAG: PilZ domain-containing protein [Deltaproteobacteria bacterium]|nr:MAG: PilZ domain-containing protein [Deltaproteobacteria bacterium]
MDKRKHPRLPKSLPMQYEAGPKKSARSPKGQGVVGNISLGGMFFKCAGPLKLESGQTLEFTVAMACNPAAPGPHETSFFKGQGTVVRIEPPEEGSPFFGIAVQFSQPLSLSQVMETTETPIQVSTLGNLGD